MSKPRTKVALVDDHSLLRNSLAALITGFEGYEVLYEADHGKDFIQQLPQYPSPPDIVLLDITMPEMNGFETAAWIKQNLPAAKILVLSMMDNDTAIISMLKAGARGYLLKDSKPVILKQALDDIRDKGFYMNELVNNKMLNYVVNDEQKKDTDIISQLTAREITFLKLACSEMSYKQIAAEMQLSSRTVEGYRDDLFKKLNIVSRVGLVIFAIKNGIHKI
jgi:DNA-binding NarL/FixJ family response regulator